MSPRSRAAYWVSLGPRTGSTPAALKTAQEGGSTGSTDPSRSRCGAVVMDRWTRLVRESLICGLTGSRLRPTGLAPGSGACPPELVIFVLFPCFSDSPESISWRPEPNPGRGPPFGQPSQSRPMAVPAKSATAQFRYSVPSIQIRLAWCLHMAGRSPDPRPLYLQRRG